MFCGALILIFGFHRCGGREDATGCCLFWVFDVVLCLHDDVGGGCGSTGSEGGDNLILRFILGDKR